jgi:hypothetical protein
MLCVVARDTAPQYLQRLAIIGMMPVKADARGTADFTRGCFGHPFVADCIAEEFPCFILLLVL